LANSYEVYGFSNPYQFYIRAKQDNRAIAGCSSNFAGALSNTQRRGAFQCHFFVIHIMLVPPNSPNTLPMMDGHGLFVWTTLFVRAIL